MLPCACPCRTRTLGGGAYRLALNAVIRVIPAPFAWRLPLPPLPPAPQPQQGFRLATHAIIRFILMSTYQADNRPLPSPSAPCRAWGGAPLGPPKPLSIPLHHQSRVMCRSYQDTNLFTSLSLPSPHSLGRASAWRPTPRGGYGRCAAASWRGRRPCTCRCSGWGTGGVRARGCRGVEVCVECGCGSRDA